MNILFIGQFRINGDGTTEAAKSLARAIRTIPNVNLTIRNINMANKSPSALDIDLIDLEKKSNHYDFIFEKVLPDLYFWQSPKVVAFHVFETELNNHIWLNRLNNLTDIVCVPSQQEKSWLDKKLKIPCHAISEPIDIDKYRIKYPRLDMFQDNTFYFTIVGENIPRKNIMGAVLAYLAEFNHNENVMLIIKTNMNITDSIHHMKNSLRRYMRGTKYPPICLITNWLNEDQICSLIQHSNIILCPSFGEAFHRPSAYSIALGRPVIFTSGIGVGSYVTEDYGWIIDSYKDCVYCETPPVPNIYTSDEYHYVPSINSFRGCMRQSFSDKDLYNQKRENIRASNIAEMFRYETVGKKIEKIINE